jgi:hypothetical protein
MAQYRQGRDDLAPYRDVATGAPIYELDDDGNPKLDGYGNKIVSGYEGGALNTLAEYGRGDIRPGDYIPDSNIPQFQQQNIGYAGQNPLAFGVEGEIPDYQKMGDIELDPSYQFRKNEMQSGVDATMASMGKFSSGNRVNEIMERTGEMASQEYAAADARHVRDYGIGRDNESNKYTRDVYGYERDYGAETDQYGRRMGEDSAQYGRYMDDFNAGTSRENMLYGRGVDDYTRAYSAEGDYLNRQANLASIGQTSVNSGNALGANAATNAGNQLVAAGNATAAGQVAGSNAWGNAFNSLGTAAANYATPTALPPNSVPSTSAVGGWETWSPPPPVNNVRY